MNNSRGAVVPLSMNLGMLDRPDETNWHFFLGPLVDYAVSETPINNTAELSVRAATLRALGVGYVPSLKPRGRGENRVAIATFYGMGGQPIVPWDVYNGIDEAGQPKRFFGTVDEYGDLYHFVRNHAELFDHLETAAVVGIPVPVDKFNFQATMALVRRLSQQQVPFAFVLTGGTEKKFFIEPEHARHFKALIMVNQEEDFAADELGVLRSLPVARIDAGELSDSALRDLSPFMAVGESSALKLYPRASARGLPVNNLVLHLVDEARGEQPTPEASCRRRIAVKKSLIGEKRILAATWYSFQTTVKLPLTGSAKETYVTIPECTLWGVLTLEIQ